MHHCRNGQMCKSCAETAVCSPQIFHICAQTTSRVSCGGTKSFQPVKHIEGKAPTLRQTTVKFLRGLPHQFFFLSVSKNGLSSQPRSRQILTYTLQAFSNNPTQIFADDVQEEKGENARLSAFVGAIAVGDLVKSTLGPKGMDKILQSA